MIKRLIVVSIIAIMTMMLVPQQETTAQDQEYLFTIHSTETPIIARGDIDSWHNRWNEPAGIVYHNDMFYLFRNGLNARPSRKAIGISTSVDGLNWSPVNDGQPVLESSEVPLTRLGITGTTTLVRDDGTWMQYMHTQESQNWPYVIADITVATADNPFGPWEAHDSLVLERGSEGEWDAFQVSSANVHQTEDGFIMYYAGFSEDREISIGMATSEDGYTWTKYDDPSTTEAPYAESDPILVGQDGLDAVMPQVLNTPDGWVMIYKNVSYNGDILLTTSQDGIEWTTQDVVPVSEDQFGVAAGIGFMKFFYRDGVYYLFLEAVPQGNFSQIYLATYEGSLSFE